MKALNTLLAFLIATYIAMIYERFFTNPKRTAARRGTEYRRANHDYRGRRLR
jgi:hypothetical protein